MNPDQILVRSRRLRLASLLPAALALLCTGCTGVYVSRPLGDTPHALKPADWEGTWLLGDSASRVRVTDAANGKLELIGAKFTEGKPSLEVTRLAITESGDWLFATVIDDENPGRAEWARIKRDDDWIVAWLPAKDAFRALVRSGKLSGQLDQEHVALDPPTPAQLHALTSGALGVPFNWDEPIVLRRIAR
jgi:hypothetical protein